MSGGAGQGVAVEPRFEGVGRAGFTDVPLSSPERMARRLVRYIADASTVRARVLEQFGQAPDRAWIEGERARFLEREARAAERLDWGEFAVTDALEYAPRARSFENLRRAVETEEAERQRAEEEAKANAAQDAAALDALARRRRILGEDFTFVPAGASRPWRFAIGPADPADAVLTACHLERVTAVTGFAAETFVSHTRFKPVVRARQLAAAVLLAHGASTERAGNVLGRDHSTVIHALKKFFEDRRRNPETARAWAVLAPCVLKAAQTPAELRAMAKVRR